jgi:hypothetical protein
MTLVLECHHNNKQVKIENTKKEPGRIAAFLATQKAVPTPAYVRGTKQEVSTFLLNNHHHSFSGDGTTMYYSCYTHAPLKKGAKYYSPVSAATMSPIQGAAEVLAMLIETGADAALHAFDAHTVELAVSSRKADLVNSTKAKESRGNRVTFHDLVPIIWG